MHSLSRGPKRPYDVGMQRLVFEDITSALGFSERDAANVRALARHTIPAIPAVLERFYEVLLKDEGVRAAFAGGDQQVARQRAAMTMSLRELLEGRCDESQFEKRRAVGAAHVRAGVPQHYLVAGIELIWQELESRVRTASAGTVDEKLRSLRKLLVFELAVILDGYKESYSEQVRRSERSVVEEKLTRAEHLAEIGQLAASLAHEIKNPLAGISGAIQIIRDAMASDDPHQPIVTEILGQISRLDATVKDLLQYARPNPPRAAPVALDEVVTRVLTLLREEPALQGVAIEYDEARTNTTVNADDRQIEQLLINLILNAAHASDKGGVIHLGIAGNTSRVRLMVKDEGRGMPSEVRDRAFEPFFTTKAKGTGLGLSICRRITEVHGGDIGLESEVGKGTTVTVTLPRTDEGGGPRATS